MLRICVAGVTIEFEPADPAFFAGRMTEYLQTGDVPAQMRMESRVVDEITMPDGELLSTVRRSRVMRLPGGNMAHYLVDEQTQQIIQLSRYAPDFSHVQLWFAPLKSGRPTTTEYEYAYTAFEFANRLSALGGAVLHGSAIAYRGEGVIFSAPSGTGKSTHTSLWKQCFGEDVTFINDDKPALRFPEGERPLVYGAPWSGKTALNHNICVPLRAIVFVERGNENTIRRLDITESMLHLSEELVRPYMDEQLGARLVDRMVLLAQGTPIYLLTCAPEPAAALFARAALFDEQR